VLFPHKSRLYPAVDPPNLPFLYDAPELLRCPPPSLAFSLTCSAGGVTNSLTRPLQRYFFSFPYPPLVSALFLLPCSAPTPFSDIGIGMYVPPPLQFPMHTPTLSFSATGRDYRDFSQVSVRSESPLSRVGQAARPFSLKVKPVVSLALYRFFSYRFFLSVRLLGPTGGPVSASFSLNASFLWSRAFFARALVLSNELLSPDRYF